MRIQRLSGRKTCDRVLRKGKAWKGQTMTVRWLPGHPKRPDVDPLKPGIFAGTYASAKLEKSAVKRNRMRRRCREALRLFLKEQEKLPTLQLLIAPRSSSLSCTFAEIQADVNAFFSSLHR